MKEAEPRLALGRIVLLAVLVAVTAGPGCEEWTAEPAPTKASSLDLRLAINPVPQGALVIIAQENGYFRADGLKVDISRFTTGKLAFDAVLGGAADVATVADIPIMYAAMSGQKPAVLATIERSGNSVKILARKDKDQATPGSPRQEDRNVQGQQCGVLPRPLLEEARDDAEGRRGGSAPTPRHGGGDRAG